MDLEDDEIGVNVIALIPRMLKPTDPCNLVISIRAVFTLYVDPCGFKPILGTEEP